MKRQRKSYLKQMRQENKAFLSWLLERPRAFVVFRKDDLKALRK